MNANTSIHRCLSLRLISPLKSPRAVYVTQLSGVTSNTLTHTPLKASLSWDVWSPSTSICLRLLTFSLVPHDRPSKVSVNLLLLIWYYCCQPTNWSLSTFYPRHSKVWRKATWGPKDQSVKQRKEERVGVYTGALILKAWSHVCPNLMCHSTIPLPI